MDSSSTSTLPSTPSTLTQRRRSADQLAAPSQSNDSSAQADKDPAAKHKQPVVPPSPRTAAALLTVDLTRLDVVISLILFLFAFAVRAHRLTSIQSVIFDEVHYINFSNHILRGEYFFDVNPVFGKLLIAFVARIFGFDPNFPNAELGKPIPTATQAFAARIPSVVFGSLTVPVFYRVGRMLHLSTFASVIAALFILLDSMHVIQSRIAMVDSLLVYFSCAALLCALNLWQSKNIVVIKGQRVTARDAAYVALFLVLTGVHCGLAFSVRWTAFATPVLIFTISFFGIGPFCMKPLNAFELIILYSSAMAAYCGSFAAFLMQVNRTGNGDNFMSREFQSCLIGNPNYTGADGCKLSMWRRIIEVNRTIFRYSKGIRGNDKWGSSWFQWIINWRGALYYRDAPDSSSLSIIYLLMNPVMTASIDALMLVFITVLFVTVRYRKQYVRSDAFRQHLRRGGVLFFGWLLSMLPTMVVYRSGPVYQYLPGLFFAQGLAAIGFDLIPKMGRPVAALVLAVAMVAAFLYWGPWVYGQPLSHAGHLQRRWMPRWD